MVMKMFSALISFLSANLLYFILHINNTSSFPKPLNSKDEAAALQRLKQGDPDARALLIERNLRLVSHIVKKYYSKTNDTDDLISIGTIGLIKAIDSFNPDKNIRLATYASRCIENEILMYFRNIRKNSTDIYLGDSIEIDKDGNPLTIQDTVSDNTDLAEELEKKLHKEKKAHDQDMLDFVAELLVTEAQGGNPIKVAMKKIGTDNTIKIKRINKIPLSEEEIDYLVSKLD